jgi:hypothetical protein
MLTIHSVALTMDGWVATASLFYLQTQYKSMAGYRVSHSSRLPAG